MSRDNASPERNVEDYALYRSRAARLRQCRRSGWLARAILTLALRVQKRPQPVRMTLAACT